MEANTETWRGARFAGALLVLLGGCPSSKDAAVDGLAPAKTRDRRFQRGISLGLFVSDPDLVKQQEIYGKLLDELVAAGATDLQLVVRWAQADVRSTEITPQPAISTEDALLMKVTEEAKKRGLRVFLLPIVHLESRGHGEWRGTLKSTDPEQWWASYRRFILHYARFAAAEELALFSVGSELVDLEREELRWRALIAEVRAVFSGPLTYSANWDHFEPIGFWDVLDVIGVTGYAPLSSAADPSEEVLIAGWHRFASQLRVFAAGQGRPYLFTEIGYPSNDHAAHRPWDYRESGEPNLRLQLRCYRAMYGVWQNDPNLEGVYLWNWFGFGGPEDRGYSPRGKPAAKVIAHWYLGSREIARSP